LYVAVVMPDHVDMVFTPQVNTQATEIWSLASIMDANIARVHTNGRNL
jgi:hypothetical protein